MSEKHNETKYQKKTFGSGFLLNQISENTNPIFSPQIIAFIS